MQYALPSQPSSKKAASPPSAFDNAAPFNLDAEQALLGAILINNAALEKVADFLSASDFFDPLHQQIYEIAAKLIAGGRLASPVTLKAFFDGAEPIHADLTVPQYLGRLCVHASTIIGAADYGKTIHDLAIRRGLILIGEDMVATARESAVDASPALLIEEAEARLFSLAHHSAAEISTTLTFAEAMSEAVSHAQAASQGKHLGLRTGLQDLDAKLGGLQPTDLIILAGRPSMGKTALATNIAFHVAQTQCPVHFFSLEMSASQLAMRVLGEQIEVSASRLRAGKASRDQMEALARKAQDLGGLPLFTDQLGGISIAQLSARARRLKRRQKIGLVVVDYIQLMQSTRGRRDNRVQEVSEITAGLKALAKELAVPILALSQLNRAVESRDNKRPQLADLRDSGSIEQDADVVMFTFREEYYVAREEPSVSDFAAYADWQEKMRQVAGKAEIMIPKARHSEISTIPVAFSGEFTRFSNLAREVGNASRA